MRSASTLRIKRLRYRLIPAPQRAATALDGAQCIQAQNAPQTGANGAKTRGCTAAQRGAVRKLTKPCARGAALMQYARKTDAAAEIGAKIVPTIGVQVMQILFAFYVAQ